MDSFADRKEELVSTLDLLRSRRDELLAIAARHGGANLRVFGSVARGEDTGASDLDFLVDMAEERSLYDLVGLQQEIEKLLGRKTDLLTENGISRYLRERILAEAVEL